MDEVASASAFLLPAGPGWTHAGSALPLRGRGVVAGCPSSLGAVSDPDRSALRAVGLGPELAICRI